MQSDISAKAPENHHSQHKTPHNHALRIIDLMRCTALSRDRRRLVEALQRGPRLSGPQARRSELHGPDLRQPLRRRGRRRLQPDLVPPEWPPQRRLTRSPCPAWPIRAGQCSYELSGKRAHLEGLLQNDSAQPLDGRNAPAANILVNSAAILRTLVGLHLLSGAAAELPEIVRPCQRQLVVGNLHPSREAMRRTPR